MTHPEHEFRPRTARAAVEPWTGASAVPPDPAAIAALRDQSIASGPSTILWDLVGSCNLRCPSCPQGTMRGTNSGGLIDFELYLRLLNKLAAELPTRQLAFYNWTEPLIHPRINDIVAAAADLGYHIHLSSNLNVLRDPDGLLAARPKTIRVSLSGFTQPVYEVGHRNGDIERVKSNMRRLAEAKQRGDRRTRLHVYYHKYRFNLDEVAPMEAFARSLGFDFLHDYAYLMPLEKIIHCVEGELPPAEQSFVDESIVPRVADSIALAQRFRNRPCALIDQLVLDHRGNAVLCCGVFDQAAHAVGNFLETPWEQIQHARYGHRTCDRCMHYGIHVFGTYFDKPEVRAEMEQMAGEALAEPALARPGRSVQLPILGAA